jgi:predicted dehydrogenase
MTIGVGLIGWGYWGPNLGRNLAASERCRLTAVADPSPERLSLAAAVCPAARLTPSAESLLADPDIDAVVIATPAASHCALALAALHAGKHVLVEKPFTRTSSEALRLIEESERRGLILMVDHTFLFSPAVHAVRDLLGADALGPLQSYESARLNLGIVRSDVNVLWDIASHDLALLDQLVATAPVAVRAEGTTPLAGGGPHDAVLTLSYANGFSARLRASWTTPEKTRTITITGRRRQLLYDDMARVHKVTVYESGRAVLTPELSAVEPLRLMVDHFVGCIADRTRPLTDGASALRVVRQLEAAEQSLAQSGAVVTLDHEGIPA